MSMQSPTSILFGLEIPMLLNGFQYIDSMSGKLEVTLSVQIIKNRKHVPGAGSTFQP
jgi:hypothetical protein